MPPSRNETRNDTARGRPGACPTCRQPFTPIGRQTYCTPACREAAHRYRHPDRRAPLTVEIDHGSTSSRGRPAGHVWLVRIRRGNRQAILAAGLGRPSAEHLAKQIREVIDPPPLAAPAQTR